MIQTTRGLDMGGGIGGLLDLRQGGQNYSYLYDGKGNVTALLDGSEAVAATYTYDTFGNLMSQTGSLSQPFEFSTKLYDEQTGLSYFGYRFYSPTLGRWMTQDPIGYVGGMNLYRYVGNDPVNWIDPFGLQMEMTPETATAFADGIDYLRSGEADGELDSLQLELNVGGLIPFFGEPFDLSNALISAFRGNYGEAALGALAAVPLLGYLGTGGKACLKYSDDAAALIDLAKKAKKTGVDAEDAQTLLKWADEYNVPSANHIGETHWKHGDHIRIGSQNHIKVR